MISKCYVIKNKEGKYWCGNDRFSATLDIRRIYFCEDFDFISKVINKLSSEGLLKDCTIVPITISEGDLEEENRELKAKLETAEYWNRKYDGLLERVNDIKKALKLACKRRLENVHFVCLPNNIFIVDEKELYDYYIQQAKESEKDDDI